MSIVSGVELAPLTTMGVGGRARHFARVESEAELASALAWAKREGLPTFVLGGGSNLVIADQGLDALVIHVCLRGVEMVERERGRVLVKAAAGEPWDDVVAASALRGLAGVECLSGIPGFTGATPIQNVGAYGQEVSDVVTRVVVIERATGGIEQLSPQACAFGYRDSAFKRELRGRFIVASVELALSEGRAAPPRYAELARAMGPGEHAAAAVRQKVIELRTSKAMVYGAGGPDNQSAGSFFMNPIVSAEAADRAEQRARARGALSPAEKMPRFDAQEGRVKLAAGWLIERSGFQKGTAHGPVGLSTKHALAIVNRGGATASDIVSFARFIRDGVQAQLGVRLVPEPELVGFAPREIDDLVGPAVD